MCEVNSCCCLSLRQGCVLIGGVTILVSLVQTLIFSWVLVETYQSYRSALDYSPSIDTSNSSMDESSSSTYSFDSDRCPFGFLSLSTKVPINESTEDEDLQEEVETNFTSSPVQSLVTHAVLSSDGRSEGPTQASPLALGLTLEEEEKEDMKKKEKKKITSSSSSSSSAVLSPSHEIATLSEDGSPKPLPSSSSAASPLASAFSTSSDVNDSYILLTASSASSSVPLSSSYEPLQSNSSSFRTLNKTKSHIIKCIAPGQGLLWALVVVSALYLFVGILLIFAILYCVSWQLSIWFFYTVGYNLFTLIVAMTDGNYTSLSDISSYVVCVITTYCVIVVDSYYEKQLLNDERTDKNGPSRRRSSLVIVRSSPDSPTSGQPEYIPPTTYRIPANHNTLAPPPPHGLAPPPTHGLAPPPAHPLNLTAPPTRPPSYNAHAERNRDYPNYAYHNNL